jgi:tripartite-type tricarboxylate transporter receptor subunit TctC
MRPFHVPRLIIAATMAQLLLLGTSGAGARADGFPEPGRPITIIVPWAAGGATDTEARMMAAALEPLLKTTVVVVDRPGAGSQVGLTQLVRSKPDGYTLAYVVLPGAVTHYLDPARQAIYTRTSFQPIARHTLTPEVITVRADSPYHSLKELVDAARAHPNTITVGDAGQMSSDHLCTLMLGHEAGVQFNSIHFEGGAPSIMALLGGHVNAMSGGVVDAAKYTRTGQFRVLGVCDNKPDPMMPDAPTMKSLGYDVVDVSNAGVVAPAGTPQDVVDVLSRAMKTVIESPEHQQKIHGISMNPAYLGPADFTQVWIDIEARLRPIFAGLRTQ